MSINNEKSVPKVIKVVNLKRFMPEKLVETTPKRKKSWFSSVLNQESHLCNTTKDTPTNNANVQECQTEIPKGTVGSTIDNSSDLYTILEPYSSKVQENRSKIKFRNCMHTPEELSSLQEHVNETLVKVGDEFESRESFREHLNNNAAKWYYYYVCRNSKKKIIEYNCICRAYNYKQRKEIIRRQKKRTTACPCKIRLAINQTSNKVVVYYVCNHHDHATTPAAFYHYPHVKYLPQHVKDEFLDLTYLGLEGDLIQKYIHSLIGLKIKKKDIWSYAYRFKRKIYKRRSLSDERLLYMDSLIIKIREMFCESFETSPTAMSNEHPEVLGSIDTAQTTQSELDSVIKSDSCNNTVRGLLAIDNELNICDNNSLKKDAFGDSAIDTEVIVQYINEDGILCDENGLPITNSATIMHFINNHKNVTPGSVDNNGFIEPGTDFSELEDSIHEINPPDWNCNKSVNGKVLCKNVPQRKDTQGSVLNDANGDTEDNIVTVKNDKREHRSSPTPESPGMYAEMDVFKKYYYVDHRYITCRQNSQEQSAIQFKEKTQDKSDSNSSCPMDLEEYIKAPVFVYWPSIRHCSGHEHLTTLTDPDAILPGTKFLTHEVFLTYINERANRWFFYYSLVESGKNPENYVYKCVYGKHRVSKNAYRAKGLRKRNKLTTQCPCQIRLRRLESNPTYLSVLYSCNHHDHALDETQFNAQPHSRRLPQHIKEEVKDLLALSVGTDVLRKYVASETGLRVYAKYFHNVRVAMRERKEQRHFSEERLRALTKKIRDLEAIYGNAVKENPQEKLLQSQGRKCRLPPLQVQEEPHFMQVDDVAMQIQEYCELSDKDDFAEEVYIAQADSLPAVNTVNQSRLETRLQNLSHKEILMKVKKLQDSVRCDGLRSADLHYLDQPLV